MKLLVIGGGIGGYVCAIRAAQLGAEVTLAERKYIGGTCLNAGCIPTKALLESAQLFDSFHAAKDHGIEGVGELSIDFQKVQQRKQEVVNQLVKGIGLLLEKRKIEVLDADVRLIDGKTVVLNDERRTFDAIILATGSEPIRLPIPGMELDEVIDSTIALELIEIPDSLVIIGGGVIGSELASLFCSFGTKVTILEMMDRIVPTMDPAISEMLTMTLESRGITIHTGAKVLRVEKRERPTVFFEKNGQTQELAVEKVLIATGRRPVMDVLEGASIRIAMDRHFIKVDQNMRTNIDGLYAIGDVTGKSMLAHTAEEMGIRVAEYIMGKKTRPIDYQKIPSCLYTQPEAASCGLTEPQAIERGLDTKVGIFPLFNNARALIANQAENTFVKVIAEKTTGELLGVHIFGPYATEMIGEVALALELECTVKELMETIQPHPTVSEGIKEGASSVYGSAIHML